MEYKIGQIFEIDGIWYQFVEDNRDICKGCVFYQSKIKCTNPDEDVKCSKWHREDGKDGHFVRLLPIGDVYEQGGERWRQYKCVEKPNTEDKRVYIANTDSEVALIVSIRLTSSNGIERKIGEVFEYNGEWYQCLKSASCDKCAFLNSNCIDSPRLKCGVDDRSDNCSVIFQKLEKVGEPFERNGYMNQEYKAHTYPLLMSGGAKIPTDNGFAVIIKQNKEDMEENKLKPFDIEAAKAGKTVCTRDGRKARIICFDYKGDCGVYPILALISTTNQRGVPDEIIAKYTEDGKYADIFPPKIMKTS